MSVGRSCSELGDRVNWLLLRRQMLTNLRSIRFVVIIVVSVVLIVVQYWTAHFASFRLTASAPTFLREVMLFSPDGTGSGLYSMILPFLSALLGGSVIAVERHSGRLQALLARESKGSVMRTSLLSGFLLGGIGGSLPLILNLIGAVIAVPHLNFIDGRNVEIPMNADGTFANPDNPVLQPFVLIDETSWAYPLYRFNQPLFIVCIVLLVFVISGLFAVLAVSASLFLHRRYVELLIPFILNLVWWMLPTLTNGLVPDQWSYIIFLSPYLPNGPEQMVQTYIGMGITVFGLVALSAMLNHVGWDRDVL